MSEDRPASPPKCEHFWVSHHPAQSPIFIRQCEFCRTFDVDDLKREIDRLADTDSLPGKVDTAEDFTAKVLQERQRQVAKGYDAQHDDQQGIQHLFDWAGHYAYHGEPVKAQAMVEAARGWVFRNKLGCTHPPEALVMRGWNQVCTLCGLGRAIS